MKLVTQFQVDAMRSCSLVGLEQIVRLAMASRPTTTVAFERLMRLALKAQSNCRATAEALAAIQNPPTVFARQANFANGPQQINNSESRPVRVAR